MNATRTTTRSRPEPPAPSGLDALRQAVLAGARALIDAASGASEPLAPKLLALLDTLPPSPKKKSAETRRGELRDLFAAIDARSAAERATDLLRALALIEALARSLAVAEAPPAPDTPGYFPDRAPLYRSLQSLKGVGKRGADGFAARGILTIEDLLFFLPRRYEDLRIVTRIRDLAPGTQGQGAGTIAAMTQPGSTWQGRKPFEVIVQDESGTVTLSWFHYGAASVPKRFAVGDRVRFAGKVSVFRGKKQIVHPTLRLDEELVASLSSQVLSFYPEIQELTAKRVEALMRETVPAYLPLIADPLPSALLMSLGLPDLRACLGALHSPPPEADIAAFNEGHTNFHARMAFDELFFVQVALARVRGKRTREKGFAHKRLNNLARIFYRHFPYRLTGAQKRALLEIVDDLTAEHPMNRLLQGDVGSGKTIVAVLSALLVVENGRQVAFMAPTEILAEQHYHAIAPLCALAGVRVGLLTSETLRQGRTATYEDVATGRLQVVIGTQALIQRGLTFHDLGYVIIDEQHRFGVRQRAALRDKGRQPDCLVMTATPIPRSLTLTLYGDLDVSILDERPPGRLPIATHVYWMSEWERVDRTLRSEIESGRQAYIVSPLIEDSEKLDIESASAAYERLVARYPDFTIALLHGRLPAEDKDRLMRAFVDGVYDILVATSVIEVGVDVPNATLMIVLHAERFGLSQLHQLRGRIGRGRHASSCFLLCDKLSDDGRERLGILEETDDGFRIAEKDLEIRGPGEFLGTRQAGAPLFEYADLLRDQELLKKAREAADSILKGDPELALPEHQGLRATLTQRWAPRLGLIGIG